MPSPGDLLFFNVLIISHTSSSVGFSLCSSDLCTVYHFFHLSIIDWSLPITLSSVFTNRHFLLETSLDPVSYYIEFSCFISFTCFLHTFQHFRVMEFFFGGGGSTHFLGFPSPVFVIISIQAHPHIQHFESGFFSFFHLSLAFFIIPIIPLLPLFPSNHLNSN